jgi:hypothetical protein
MQGFMPKKPEKHQSVARTAAQSPCQGGGVMPEACLRHDDARRPSALIPRMGKGRSGLEPVIWPYRSRMPGKCPIPASMGYLVSVADTSKLEPKLASLIFGATAGSRPTPKVGANRIASDPGTVAIYDAHYGFR